MRYEKENDFTREPAPFSGSSFRRYAAGCMGRYAVQEYVVDDAGLFTDKEKEQLTKMCRKASDACKTDVVILTQSKGLDDKELEMMYAALLMKATAMMKAVRSRMQLSMSLI